MKVHVRIKLSALWTSVMLCYLYGDFFGLYVPGTVKHMLNGEIGELGPATQGIVLAMALTMAIPSAMVFLSLVLEARICRWANIVLGALYTAIMLVSMSGMWTFYIALGVIEIVLTLFIVRYAWTWPKRVAA
ncbi:MAG: hypothetical protein HOP03_08920 [Lysobacter sp.]|nr:hypothetical protein [Lysobacter sp.]